MNLVWDDRAISDLETIVLFIAEDRPRTAVRVGEYIRQSAERLRDNPGIGIRIPDRPVRQLVLARYPYRLLYSVEGDQVVILAVFHYRQRL